MRVLAEDFSAMFASAVVFDVTNVQSYLSATKSLSQEPFDLPVLSPPFPVTFFEFVAGHSGLLKGTRQGVLMATWDRHKDPDGERTSIPAWMRIRDSWEFQGKTWDPSVARWHIQGMLVSAGGSILPKNQVSGPEASFSILLNDDGSVCRFDGVEPVSGAYFPSLGNRDADTAYSLVGWGGLKFALLPCFFATTLLNCRNVTKEENVPQPKLSRAFQRRTGKPLTRFYTLSVGPIGAQRIASGPSSEHKVSKSLHICRGHFATYSEDKPLFGKYAGRFWIPAHVRGSTEAGTVVKDYRVKAPANATN